MKNLDDICVLTQPGRGWAGPGHWLTHWEESFPSFVRVEQTNWSQPVYAHWSTRMSQYIASASKPVLLIGHSLGTSLITRWTFDQPELASRVIGALLAAPTDRDMVDGDPNSPVSGFGPMLLEKMPFRSIVLASQNDPFVTLERAKLFAAAWGSWLVDAGSNGHLASAANLGVWPRGLLALGQLLEGVE